MAFPWPGSTALLLLWICCTAVDAQNGCGPPPRRDREELADLSPKESYSHDDIVLYNCRPGYIKLGRFRMQCKNGNWEQAPPYIECKKKPCGHPGDIQFGSFELVEGDGFYFGARVVYRCDEGYQMLSRTDFRVCRADGWSNDVPHCEITKCFPVKEPENGRIVQTGIMDLDQDFLFGHLLRFECVEHFKIEGSAEIVCTAQGTWSAPVPKCVEVTCQPQHIDHGRILAQRAVYKDGEQIQFSCDRGYRHADRKEATCTRNGWNGRLECIEIVCLPPHLQNGNFQPRGLQFRYEEQIEIKCDDGFQSAGSSRCTEQGWQPPATCIPKNCGHVRLSNGYFYYNEPLHSFPKRLGYTMDYHCNSGFLPPNKENWQKIKCTKTGWDPEPKCFKTCEHRYPFTNGKFIYSSWTRPFIEGDKITYFCNKGYRSATENTTVTCTKAGWSPTPRCAILEEIRPSSCENIAPQNGFFVDRKDRFSLSETVTYRCQSGFTTAEGHEEGQIQCQAEGWKPEPKCIKTCLMPNEENAVFDTTKPTFSSKEILRYVCKDGFQTVRETTGDNIQCTDNGWDQKPVCLPIECEGPVLENGRVEERKDKFVNGDVVRFSCSKGYTRVGPDSAQCYHFGWSPQPPKCKKTANPCVQPNSTSPLSPAYGERREEYQHGVKVAYECDIGFVMTGSNTIECVDGEWTSLPSCTEELKTCGRPPRITSGRPINVDEHRYKHNETVDYECWGEIDIPGPVTATCLHGKWELPLCTGECRRPKNTKFVPDVPNKEFKYNETANYSCHSTFHTTKCVGGKWSPEPECKELCPPPPQLPNAINIREIRNYKNGEEVGYKCVEPFVLQGPQKIMCEGGRWQTPPRCVDTRCGDPPSIPNGEARHDAPRKYAPGESMEYFCHEGFEIVGSRTTAKCENMEWSKLPSCKEKSCQKPPAIFNASYRKTVKLSYKPGDKVDYECHPGFAAKGPQTITCRRGEWSQPSICEDVTCREPPLVDNAGIVEERAESYLPGHELHYQCHEGFEISGSDTIRCENKKWSTPPRCEDMRCSPPPDIENGQLNGVRKPWYFPLEKVKYRCLPSYSLFGPYAAMCLKREWINLPECRDVAGRCDRPPSIENGDILEMAKSEYLSGENVHYKCQILYRMDGNAEVTCHNGHWTQPPTCIVPCTASEEDMKMNNIQLKWKYDSKLYSESGDSTEFICRWGYRPDRTSPPFRVQCIDGRFEYPRCVRSIYPSHSL
ncbi:complement factor H isoform X3 [Pogona vitticeps]